MNNKPQQGPRPAWIQAILAHPYIAVFNLVCLLAGVVIAIDQLPGDWSLARRSIAGAFSGISIGLLITANRMLGAWR